MLAVQRYRPQKYPPGPDFAQFGDSLFAGHVKAAGRMASNRRREFATIHMGRLDRAGLQPYNTEFHTIHTPERGFESVLPSLVPSRAPSEEPMRAASDFNSVVSALPSRAPSEYGDGEAPRPQVTEGGSQSPSGFGGTTSLLRQGMSNMV